jgi:PleD family two-component response regulator
MLDRLTAATSQGFSAGVAVSSAESTVEDLLRSADQACYLAKQTGRGQAVVADGSPDRAAV